MLPHDFKDALEEERAAVAAQKSLEASYIREVHWHLKFKLVEPVDEDEGNETKILGKLKSQSGLKISSEYRQEIYDEILDLVEEVWNQVGGEDANIELLANGLYLSEIEEEDGLSTSDFSISLTTTVLDGSVTYDIATLALERICEGVVESRYQSFSASDSGYCLQLWPNWTLNEDTSYVLGLRKSTPALVGPKGQSIWDAMQILNKEKAKELLG